MFVPTGPINNIIALVQNMAWCWQAIIWTNDGIVYWCIYASLGLNELTLLPEAVSDMKTRNIHK